jgi:hypothetical protein
VSEIGSIYFWRIIHSALKQDDSEEEAKRALGVVRWVYQHRQALEDSLSQAESLFLRPILQNYEVHSTTLSPTTLKDVIEDEQGKAFKVLDELYHEYLDTFDELNTYSEADMAPLMRQISGISLQEGMESAWSNARKILTSDPDIKVKGEEKMNRYEKAYNYLRGELVTLSGKLAHLEDNSNRNASMVEDADLVREKYIDMKSQDQDSMLMPMGVPIYDDELKTKRGHFFGILGFGGHRKTTLARTWAYNSIVHGHNVGHWALEMGIDDEFHLYSLMHCHKKYGPKGFSRNDYDRGEMNPKAEELFFNSINSNQLSEDLKGDLHYFQRGQMTWFELSKEIDDAIEQWGLTMAVVDYLTLLEVFSRGNEREAVNRMIQSVKPFCESRKILLVSPIQGNRDGLDRAAEHDGQWDPSGIDTYSGYFRAMDGIVGVYSPAELQNQMILSMVKNRHGRLLDPLTVSVCPDTGYITQ